MIRIGPAGWSYRDWEGIVYPKQRGLDQLQYLSELFTTIEINSTFYRPPSRKTGESWARRTDHCPDFRFTVKLGRSLTHQREEMDPAEIKQWKEGVGPLLEAGKLGAVLVQFPWSFKNRHPSREYLVRLVEKFPEMPLVIEFRHGSWDEPEVLDFLRGLGVGICGIDQPLIGHSLPPRPDVTSRVGYFRCHGRNYGNWFREKPGRDERYNYLYSAEELNQQIQLVSTIQEKAQEVYVIYNNHFQGQAVVNALQLRHRLEGGVQQIPDPLLQAYPQVGQLLEEET